MFKPMEWCYLLKRKANDKVYQYANTVFEDYVANTVFKAEIPEHFGQKKCARQHSAYTKI